MLTIPVTLHLIRDTILSGIYLQKCLSYGYMKPSGLPQSVWTLSLFILNCYLFNVICWFQTIPSVAITKAILMDPFGI